MVGYVLQRRKSRWNHLINLFVLAGLIVPPAVVPTIWVQARQGPHLADLVSQPGTTRASGDSDVIDVAGSAYAATDGDPLEIGDLALIVEMRDTTAHVVRQGRLASGE